MLTNAHQVVIVNGRADALELFEPVLAAGHYDVVFVESCEHAYSHIRSVQPNLVILCLQMDRADGLDVLSMLKLDEATRRIPVLTYTTQGDDDDEDAHEEAADASDPELFARKPSVWMN
jgi:CheY-like chemotaxis protein